MSSISEPTEMKKRSISIEVGATNDSECDGIEFIASSKGKSVARKLSMTDRFENKKRKINKIEALEKNQREIYENGNVLSDHNGTHSKQQNFFISNSDRIKISQNVRDCYNEVYKRRRIQWAQHLEKSLVENRDNILDIAKKRKLGKKYFRFSERLPSNSSKNATDLAYHFPYYNHSNDKRSDINSTYEGTGKETREKFKKNDTDVGISVKFRKKNGCQVSQTLTPSLFLEGTHRPRPPHSATVFLRSNFFTEDQQHLTYVPYFGDDDKEDVVSDVYDIDKREKMLKMGPEYQNNHINNTIKDTIQLIMSKPNILNCSLKSDAGDNIFHGNWKIEMMLGEMYRNLAMIMDVEVERIQELHRVCFPTNDTKNKVEDAGQNLHGKILPEASTSPDKIKNIESPKLHRNEIKKCEVLNSSSSKMLKYEEIMDSYRNLFCRRCFTYDCNFHGNLIKPNIDLQGELAVLKETEGHWDDIDDLTGCNSTSSFLHIPLCLPITHTVTPIESPPSRSSGNFSGRNQIKTPNVDEENRHETELNAFQRSLCKRAYLIFQGDVIKISKVIDAPIDLVEKFIKKQSFTLTPPKHIQQYQKIKNKKTKGKKDMTSMRNYNPTWLKRVQGAEIHPSFQPCDHLGLCSEENCSCVKNAFFCTKHCVWGSKSKNFFRGCACRGNQCRTKSCPCFAAKRECDPDLCRNCGACSDPPNAPAVKQRCRNDNIGMRRHCHLLVGESSIENAGWGIYTKYALKKDDYVHEYIGEVISQEEAERRGRVYDKMNRSYLFNLSSDLVVDASRKGNKTKFANHSSKPNCYTKTINVNGDIRIGLFAKENIEPQSELFFDYRYNVGMDNDLILKPGKTVDWMENPEMANQIRKKVA